jgi:3-methylfumaryl-CoA hydratase
MMAGGRLRIRTPMRVGETLTRRSSLVGAQVKHGRSGEMLLVTVRDEYLRAEYSGDGSDEPVVTDETDIVYRSQAPGQARGIGFDAAPAEAPPTSGEAVSLTPDAPLLFRFSALTYNTHRIHYDQPYVTAVEGYPGLVVHGPLLATLLLDLLRRHAPDAEVAAFRFRAVRPTFDLHPFQVNGEPGDGSTVRLWSQDHDGLLTMDAVATLR